MLNRRSMLSRNSMPVIALFITTVLTLLVAPAADASTHTGKSHAHRHAASAHRHAAVASGSARTAHQRRARQVAAAQSVDAAPHRTGRSHRLRLHSADRLIVTAGHRHRLMHRGRVIATGNGTLAVQSAAALVIDQNTGLPIYAKNDRDVVPIASITKLMTALVVLDAAQPMDESVAVTNADVDRLKLSTSRLRVGAHLTREQMLRLALMASENRAASALAHAYPGGAPAFIAAMNRKAHALNMTDSHFADATGLNSNNVSTARDLVQLVQEGWRNPYIRAYTTTASYTVPLNRAQVTFNNTNPLVKQDNWHISLSKTGFIDEAGRCLVMRATLAQKDVVIVLLNSQGKYTRIGDANRVRQWMEAHRNDLPTAPAVAEPASNPLLAPAASLAPIPLHLTREFAPSASVQIARPTESPALVLASGRVAAGDAASDAAVSHR